MHAINETYNKGMNIYSEGDESEYFYFIKEGIVEVYKF